MYRKFLSVPLVLHGFQPFSYKLFRDFVKNNVAIKIIIPGVFYNLLCLVNNLNEYYNIGTWHCSECSPRPCVTGFLGKKVGIYGTLLPVLGFNS